LSSIESIFKALNKAKVKYVLIGGLASILHGVPRTTIDIDIAVEPKKKNLEALIKALCKLGLVPETDTIPEILGQGGVTFENDRTVDVLTSTKGLEFTDIWKTKEKVKYKGVHIITISKKAQITMLKAVGREDDLRDVEFLVD
jgi:hypothetical protein